jgi:hypothetical protein
MTPAFVDIHSHVSTASTMIVTHPERGGAAALWG